MKTINRLFIIAIVFMGVFGMCSKAHALASGIYWDLYSQRAYAEIHKSADKSYIIEINWSSSAWEKTNWKMTAKFDKFSKKLVYKNCVSREIYTSEEGKHTSVRTLYTKGRGYFTVVNGKLKWNGAADKNCRMCIFEREKQ